MHNLPDADCALVLDATSDANDVPDFNVTHNAALDDFPDVNDNPDAVLDFDFPLITLDVGNVDNDEVSNVLPSSSDISEASV